MLLFRIENSMNQVLEALDRYDVSLLMEANEEFEKGYEDLKSAVGEFLSLLEKIKPMDDFTQLVKALLSELDKIGPDVKNMPQEFSFSLNHELKEGDDSEEAKIMQTISGGATTISMYINGLKDAVISVAGWLEGTPEIFSVGKNGIVVLPAFAEKNNGAPLSLQIFSKPSGDEILQSIAELPADGNQEESLKNHFSDFWNADGVTDESKMKQKWEKFTSSINKIGQGGATAFQEAENAIKNVKPDDDVQGAVKSKSILSSILGNLFGGKSKADATSPDMGAIVSKIIGDNPNEPQKGLWACTFEELQQLIQGLLAMADSANASAAAALMGINKQNQSLEKTEVQESLIEKLKKLDLDPEISGKVAKIIEDNTDGSSDISKLDTTVFVTKLQDEKIPEETIAKILKGLGIKSNKDDPEAPADKSPLDVLANFDEIPDEDKEEWLDTAQEEDLIDGEGEAKEDNQAEEVNDVVELIADELSEEEEEELESSLLPEEEKEVKEIFRRWGKLAGIIKG